MRFFYSVNLIINADPTAIQRHYQKALSSKPARGASVASAFEALSVQCELVGFAAMLLAEEHPSPPAMLPRITDSAGSETQLMVKVHRKIVVIH